MTLDINGLKEWQSKLEQESLKEIYEDLPKSLINATNNNILNYCLQEQKFGAKLDSSPRVINNWINTGVLKVDEIDKGKIRRFNKIESIWLNLVIESRKFGVPLNILEQARKSLLESPIINFSLLKFAVLETVLRKPKMVVIFEEGYSSIMSTETYSKWISKDLFPTHINFKLSELVKKEFPKNALDTDFNIANVYEDVDKIKLLYFMKTGDYLHMKLHLSKNDIRIIENSNALIENSELFEIISAWDFQKIDIVINDEVETSIIVRS